MKINKLIDHTLLKAFSTQEEIKVLCEEAKKYDFMSVCVNPTNIAFAKKELEGSDVLVCTVIGFPLGANFFLNVFIVMHFSLTNIDNHINFISTICNGI